MSRGIKTQKKLEASNEPPKGKETKSYQPPIPPETTQKGQVYRIRLNSAGEITLIVDLPIFEVSNEDRDFALEIVDKVKGYTIKKE